MLGTNVLSLGFDKQFGKKKKEKKPQQRKKRLGRWKRKRKKGNEGNDTPRYYSSYYIVLVFNPIFNGVTICESFPRKLAI